MDSLSSIINELIAERKKRGISQKQLEELSGVKQPIIARMESRATTPNLDTVTKIADALGLKFNLSSASVKETAGYKYKRAWYYILEKSIKDNSVTLLLGPRKCGKTVCLYQLSEHIENSIYYDAKTHTDDENRAFCESVIKAVIDSASKVFLIDEVTYLQYPDLFLSSLGRELTIRESDTRVVISGSQSLALKAWGMRAFASNAKYLYMDFLSYPEWLQYRSEEEISDRTYKEFILGTREFYREFSDAKAYIEGCLDETIRSNDRAKDMIYNNDCDGLTADFLIDIMFATLVILKDNPKPETFVKKNVLFDTLDYAHHKEVARIGKETVIARIADIAENKYEGLKKLDPYLFIRGLKFLYNCDLIGVVPIVDSFEKPVPYDIFSYLKEKYGSMVISKAEDRQNLFAEINFYIKYPMFYCEIVKEVLKEEFRELSNVIFGSIVECHIRGLLGDKGAMEYRNADYAEIDYVNPSEKIAVEIATYNKRKKDTHFDRLDDSYNKIMTSLDKEDTVEGIKRVPYPKMIYELSKTVKNA